MEPRKCEPTTTLGKLGNHLGLHFLDPLGGLGMGHSKDECPHSLRTRCRSYELQSRLLNGRYVRDHIGDYYRGNEGDARSLD